MQINTMDLLSSIALSVWFQDVVFANMSYSFKLDEEMIMYNTVGLSQLCG